MRTGPFAVSPRRLLGVLAAVVALASSGCVGATRATVEPSSASDADSSETADGPDGPTVASVPVPACVAQLTVEQKASQLLMVLVGSPGEAGELVMERIVGGYSLVGTQNAEVGAQIAYIASATPFPLIVSSDEEGGLVQRLRDVLGPMESARARAQGSTVAEVSTAAQNYANQMSQMGFTMNFAPVLDVGTGAGLGDRSFGDDVDTVVNYGLAVMQGTTAGGLIPVVKHWPGIGGGGADPHNASTSIATLDQLRTKDLVPFERAFALGAPAVMVSHAIIPETSDGLPASLSRPAITDVLRSEQGYNGLVITDSLGMGAVTKHAPEPSAALMSIMAGADIALLSGPGVARDAHGAIVGAANSGLLEASQLDQAVARVLAIKGIDGECPA